MQMAYQNQKLPPVWAATKRRSVVNWRAMGARSGSGPAAMIRSAPKVLPRVAESMTSASSWCASQTWLKNSSNTLRWAEQAKVPAMRSIVGKRSGGLSPEQFAGRLTLEGASMTISHESIYRFIQHRVAQKDNSWHKLLPCQKYYRGRRPKKGGPPAKTFQNYVSIDQRPDHINTRQTPGHWEADLMAFQNNKAFLLIAHERTSRKTFATIQPNKTAEAAKISLCAILQKLPKKMRKSITYDNGTEFAFHYLVNQVLKTKSYFCHTHSPWEKGGIENSIGRLRRHLPRKTDINALSQADIDTIIESHNNLPRKCLGFLTPNQVFANARKSKTVALQT
jgi:transposase, IS30 family